MPACWEGPIRAIRRWRAGNMAKSLFCSRHNSGGHAPRMPSSTRETVLPSADTAGMLCLGFFDKRPPSSLISRMRLTGIFINSINDE